MIKFKKKSIVALALAAALAFSSCGCGRDNSSSEENISQESSIEENSSDADTATSTEASTSNTPESEEDSTEDTVTEASNLQQNSTTSNQTTEVSDAKGTNGGAGTAASQPENTEAATDEAKQEQDDFDKYLDDAFKESVVNDTITLHYTLAHPENYDITPPEVTYGADDVSPEGIEADKEETQEDLNELLAFNYDLLTEDQQFTYDILKNTLETNLTFYDNPYLYEPFAYTSGLQSNLPITLAEYTFYSKSDVDDYLALLALTPDYFQLYLDFEQEKVNRGLFMSTNSANEVIRQCNDFISDPEKNLLIETFNENIESVSGLSSEEIEAYKQSNYDAVMNYIIPTYENVISFFKRNKNSGKNDLGLVYLDGGADYYKYLIASKVGSDKTPEEIIQLLDDSISEVMGDLTQTAMGNYSAYLSYFNEYEDFYLDIDPKETIEYFEDVFKEHFPAIPDIDFTVTPVHESLVDIVSPAFFMEPQLDDYQHNSIYTNLTSDGAGNLWSTLAHEGVPGHMYQFVYFLSNDPEPIRSILSFTGYSEGWATYAELMSFDYYDGYSNPCYADFERANSKLNLLVSARVEIGVNYEGWTLEDTQDYLTENGFSADSAQDLIDYVVAEPGNYQMYVLGWLEFQELRDYAEAELGDDFDEKEFHKTILDAGPCQFYLLREKVEKYIAFNKSI